MSKTTDTIKITTVGTKLKPTFYYTSDVKKYKMGTPDMYDLFNANFETKNTREKFFTTESGINIIRHILNVKKCMIYFDIKKLPEYKDKSSDELAEIQSKYIDSINSVFDKIRLFIGTLTQVGPTQKIYAEYATILLNIDKKIDKTIIGTPVELHLKNMKNSLNLGSTLVIGDSSTNVVNVSSADTAKRMILNSSILGAISSNFLSPVDPEVFDEFRQYLRQYVGEGTVLSEDTMNDSETTRQMISMALHTLRLKFTDSSFKKVKLIELKHQNVSNINEILEKCLDNPNIVIEIIKVFNLMRDTNEEYSNTFDRLNEIFSEYSKFEFDYFKTEIIEKKTINGKSVKITKEIDDVNKYFGGSSGRESNIYKFISTPIITQTKTVTKKKSKKNKNGKARSKWMKSSVPDVDSDSDTDSDSDIDDIPDVIEQEENVRSESNRIKIDINLIKDLMKFLSSAIKSNENVSDKAKSKETLNAILNGTFGETKSEFILDWWQQKYLDYTREGKSFILVGDTSGGKTKVANLATKIQINKHINNSDGFIVFLAPTSQLAVQQFANALKQYPDISHLFGLSIKSINNVPKETRVLFATPIEAERYLYPVSFRKNSKITKSDRETQLVLNKDNIENEVCETLSNTTVKYCSALIIDESQVLSPTYVQEQEVEQKMECKAIESILKAVSYEKNPNSQVILISATLSPNSIENIKEKAKELTGIKEFEEIIYTFDDIGLSDESNRATHVPIMKKQLKYPIKITNGRVEKFQHGEKITEQKLDNKAIELIARDAMSAQTVPIGFYSENELSTIETYKSFINYLDEKNYNCKIWFNLKNKYDRDRDIFGDKLNSTEKRAEWFEKISTEIMKVIRDVNYEPVSYGDFDDLISTFKKRSGIDLKSMYHIQSDELYGLLFEYNQIHLNLDCFMSEIHPYYRYGNSNSGGDFFSLKTSDQRNNTTLNNVLIAQDADPLENTSGIIPLLMKGIKYGIGLVTSTIPLGFQIEIFKYINVKSKVSGTSNPLQLLFCEYGMTMGVNFNLMAVCMMRRNLIEISASEYKQTKGRSGRRGVSSEIVPRTYSFNISNVYEIDELENLSFDVSKISSTFFNKCDVYKHLVNMIIKIIINSDIISHKDQSSIDEIIFGDAFKNLGDENTLFVRKIQLAKYQTKEIFDLCKNMFPTICNDKIRQLYGYLQKAEFYHLNIHIS